MTRKYVILACLFLMVMSIFIPSAYATTLKGYLNDYTVAPSAPQQDDSGEGIVGIEFLLHPYQAYPMIQTIFPDTPAAQSNLKPGDEVLAINHTDCLMLSRHEVDMAISDRPGDHVLMLIQRQNKRFSVMLVVKSIKDLRSPQTLSIYGYPNGLY